jgi:hypothetical protein
MDGIAGHGEDYRGHAGTDELCVLHGTSLLVVRLWQPYARIAVAAYSTLVLK